MKNTKTTAPADAISKEEANKTRILLAEDIKKILLARAQAAAQIGILDTRIAECELALADLDRREAGVEYPEEPANPAPSSEG